MSPNLRLSHHALASGGRALAGLGTLAALVTAPADAQSGAKVEVTGYVSPRCWAAVPAAANVRYQAGQWSIAGPAAARCSQGTMPLSIRVANAPSRVPAAGAREVQSARGEVEIIVSPTL